MTTQVTYMTARELDALLEYSCSLPSLATIGKRWKRHEPYQRPATCNDPKKPCGHWWMGEYVPHEDPKKIGIRWTKIEIGLPPKVRRHIKASWRPETD